MSLLLAGDALSGGGGGTPLTITHTDTKFGNTAGVHALTSVAAGALLVVTTGNQNSNQDCSISSTPSLTWNRVVDNNIPNAEIFTATFVAGGNISVTVNWGGASVQSSVCYALTGQDTVGGQGATASSQPVANVNVATTRSNSIIFCVSTNWNAPDAGAGGTNTIFRGIPTLSLYYRDVNAASFWHYRYNAATIQSYNVGYTSPNDVDAGTGTAVLEVRSASGTPPIPDTDPPNIGTLISTGNTHNSINISWGIGSDNVGVTGYDIRLGTSSPPTAIVQSAGSGTLSATLTGLTPSTTYFITVTAKDAANNSDAGSVTNILSVTTSAAPPNQAPTAPTNFQSTGQTNTTISVSWTAATDNVGVTSYQIFRVGVGTPLGTVTGTTLSFTATGLSPNTLYQFFVRAFDAATNSADSNTVSATTASVPTCSGGSGIQLSFTPITGDYVRYWGSSEFWGTGQGEQFGTIPATKHRYRRLNWCDLEGDTQGSYKFGPGSRLKTFIDTGIANRQLASFGVMTNYPYLEANNSFHDKAIIDGSTSACPAYLFTLMANEGKPGWRSPVGGHWVPNFNSTNYISRLNALYAALAAFLETTSPAGVKYKYCIGYIDIRGFGSWGEWHQNGTVSNNTFANPNNWDNGNYVQMFTSGAANAADNNLTHQGSWPSFTRLKQIIDAHKTNLPDIQLAMLMAALDANFNSFGSIYGTGWDNTLMHTKVGRYFLDNGNAFGPLAIRRDQWGDGNSYYQLPTNTSGALVTGDPNTNIIDRWKIAPILGEPPGYCVNSMTNFPNEVDSLHGSLVGNSNYGQCSIDLSSMETGFRKCGCILRPTGGCVDLTATQLIINLDWRNFGNNSQYSHWDLFFELRNSGGSLVWTSPVKSGFDPFRFSPDDGTDTVGDTYARPSLPAGTYTLSMRFADPNGYMDALQLGIQGRQNEGPNARYNLTTLNF